MKISHIAFTLSVAALVVSIYLLANELGVTPNMSRSEVSTDRSAFYQNEINIELPPNHKVLIARGSHPRNVRLCSGEKSAGDLIIAYQLDSRKYEEGDAKALKDPRFSQTLEGKPRYTQRRELFSADVIKVPPRTCKHINGVVAMDFASTKTEVAHLRYVEY